MIELTDVLKQIFTFIHLTILDLGASQLVLVVKNQPANAGDIRDSTHRYHQVVNTKIRLIIFLAAKVEKFYTVSRKNTGS